MDPTPRPPRRQNWERNPPNLSTQPLNSACYRSPDLPTQQKDSSPEETGTETGAACFGPKTVLLVQNPMNQATYDSGKLLTRPMDTIGYGSMVLAEKQDRDGRSIFFPAKVTCLMSFEIPQDEDPVANRILQKKPYQKD